MSFIHKFIEDNETAEPVKHLFRSFVSKFNRQDSIVWNKQVKQTSNEYHRKTLLKQGRCDFDNPTNGLTSEELIVLYNYYYFPMHFQSSLEIYNRLFEEESEVLGIGETFFFHDYGCGSLSSTVAFATSFEKFHKHIKNNWSDDKISHDIINAEYKYDFYFWNEGRLQMFKNRINRFEGQIVSYLLPISINGYYCFDISKSINYSNINFLKDGLDCFNRMDTCQGIYGVDVIADKFYLGDFRLIGDNCLNLPFESFCNSQNKSMCEVKVILNFSYVLASESINIKHIISIIDDYLKKGCKLIIVNQNPDLDSLNIKWEELKRYIAFNELTKGVQPIKHFGNKSKSRYEVLNFKEDKNEFYIAYERLTRIVNISEIDTEGDYVEAINTIDNLDVFNYKKTLSINKYNSLNFIQLPAINQEIYNNLEQFIDNDHLCFLQGRTILSLLNNSNFIQTLCDLIEHNSVNGQQYLFPFFSSTREIVPILDYWPHYEELPISLLNIWSSICKNTFLFNLLVNEGVVEMALNLKLNFSKQFSFCITQNNLLFLLGKKEALLIFELQGDKDKLNYFKQNESVSNQNECNFPF